MCFTTSDDMFFILIQVPLLPILPVISVFVNVYLMLKLSSATWIRFGVWMFLGRWHGIRILHPFTFQYHSSCWAANSKNWNICYSFFLFLCTADSQSLYINNISHKKCKCNAFLLQWPSLTSAFALWPMTCYFPSFQAF